MELNEALRGGIECDKVMHSGLQTRNGLKVLFGFMTCVAEKRNGCYRTSTPLANTERHTGHDAGDVGVLLFLVLHVCVDAGEFDLTVGSLRRDGGLASGGIPTTAMRGAIEGEDEDVN
ncbi:uncharacterized protein HKW66_Vig0060080 [Vigna angularis]|uniref:Uncharacterized protein n=1 Tax=Phaseolus angularis TaxID=3914 RepID=A0A8T0L5A7_PHAAN|nr:uncharacterized protein HKW66_Vig0060080 [Vigna angularis]